MVCKVVPDELLESRGGKTDVSKRGFGAYITVWSSDLRLCHCARTRVVIRYDTILAEAYPREKWHEKR